MLALCAPCVSGGKDGSEGSAAICVGETLKLAKRLNIKGFTKAKMRQYFPTMKVPAAALLVPASMPHALPILLLILLSCRSVDAPVVTVPNQISATSTPLACRSVSPRCRPVCRRASGHELISSPHVIATPMIACVLVCTLWPRQPDGTKEVGRAEFIDWHVLNKEEDRRKDRAKIRYTFDRHDIDGSVSLRFAGCIQYSVCSCTWAGATAIQLALINQWTCPNGSNGGLLPNDR